MNNPDDDFGSENIYIMIPIRKDKTDKDFGPIKIRSKLRDNDSGLHSVPLHTLFQVRYKL